MPPDHALTEEALSLAEAQAWDTVCCLVDEYGEDVLRTPIGALGSGLDTDAAFWRRWAEERVTTLVRRETGTKVGFCASQWSVQRKPSTGACPSPAPPTRDDPVALFREAGIPALRLRWREASEENWPIEYADEVQPYRLGVTGRMITLALMVLAR